MATAFLHRLAAEVAEFATTCVNDVVTCLWEVADALAEGADLISLATVGPVDEGQALLF